MTRQSKMILMFAPFALFFAGLYLLVNDMRHPVASEDRCVVTGVGQDAQKYKGRSVFIYKQSENALQDVSMRCDRTGLVMLNQAQLFITPVKSGQGAHITHKRYHFLPDRWLVDVRTGESQVYYPQSGPGAPVALPKASP